jgi:hypothetical protein
MKEPNTPEEWQRAVNLAETMLLVHSAQAYGLITGGPDVDAQRCDDLIAKAKALDIHPQQAAIDKMIAELVRG